MKKRLFALFLAFSMAFTLAGCSSEPAQKTTLSQEGLAPYALSEREKYILKSFNMESTSQIISFNAPQEAITLTVNIYRLVDDSWSRIGGGGCSLGQERATSEKLEGAFTMQLQENYTINFNINTRVLAIFKPTEEIFLDNQIMSSLKGFLPEFREIVLNEEIPVALMVYNSANSLKFYTLQDYFEPEKLQGMDLVQAVTLKFSDKGFE